MVGTQLAMLGHKATLRIEIMDKDSQCRINFKEMRVPHDHSHYLIPGLPTSELFLFEK